MPLGGGEDGVDEGRLNPRAVDVEEGEPRQIVQGVLVVGRLEEHARVAQGVEIEGASVRDRIRIPDPHLGAIREREGSVDRRRYRKRVEHRSLDDHDVAGT